MVELFHDSYIISRIIMPSQLIYKSKGMFMAGKWNTLKKNVKLSYAASLKG